ncbi:hypothetical protein B0H21DRAFT_739954 [Amylocystis lapponica]|nr:hypothetical protein B0H21DRAFT_739954 [Amylocystis lapponica]
MLPLSDGPTLELSDIMHTMSPSPAPQALPEPTHVHEPPGDISRNHHMPPLGLADASHSTPEPFDNAELETMRLRLTQLGLADPHPTNPNLTIAELTLQRSWDRTAEALIGKRRAAAGATERDYETERQIARLQDDNKLSATRSLSDTNARMSSLESELCRLRPLVLVQSSLLQGPSVSQYPGMFDFGLPETKAGAKKAKRRRDRDAEAQILAHALAQSQLDAAQDKAAGADAPMDVDAGAGPSSANLDVGEHTHPDVPPITDVALFSLQRSRVLLRTPAYPSSAITSGFANAAGPLVHVRCQNRGKGREIGQEGKGREKKARGKPQDGADDRTTPLLSDARVECYLAAARKLGRVRAGIAAGLLKEREANKERARLKEKEQKKERARQAAEAQEQEQQRIHERQNEWEQWNLTGGTDGQEEPSQLQMTPPPGSQRSTPTAQRPGTAGPVLAPSAMQFRGVPLPSHLHPSMQHAHPGSRQQSQLPMHQLPHPSHHPHMQYPGIVYMPIPAGAGSMPGSGSPAVPLLVPIPPGAWPMPSTPTSKPRQAHTPRQNSTPAEGTTTPLDSLVSAARTLMVDEDYDGDGTGSGSGATSGHDGSPRRRNAAAAELESPVPKRRRVGKAPVLSAGASGSSTRQRGGRQQQKTTERDAVGVTDQEKPPVQVKGPHAVASPLPVTRVRSALDVLADQAAQEQERRPSTGPASGRPSIEPEKRRTTVASGASKNGSRNTASEKAKGKGRATTSDDPHLPTYTSSTSQVSPTLPMLWLHPADVAAQRARRPPSAPPTSLEGSARPDGLRHSALAHRLGSHPPTDDDDDDDDDDEDAPYENDVGDFSERDVTPVPTTPPRSRAATEEPSPRGALWRQRYTETNALPPTTFLTYTPLDNVSGRTHAVIPIREVRSTLNLLRRYA